MAPAVSVQGLAICKSARPFSSALVAMRYFRKDQRVASIMIEVNRSVYLNEATDLATEQFPEVRGDACKGVRCHR
jgi:hypothetical protein